MEHRGKVTVWHTDEGWGVLDSRTVADSVWAHFSVIEADGFRALAVGEDVRFTVEQAEQDGYHWRATWVRAS